MLIYVKEKCNKYERKGCILFAYNHLKSCVKRTNIIIQNRTKWTNKQDIKSTLKWTKTGQVNQSKKCIKSCPIKASKIVRFSISFFEGFVRFSIYCFAMIILYAFQFLMLFIIFMFFYDMPNSLTNSLNSNIKPIRIQRHTKQDKVPRNSLKSSI